MVALVGKRVRTAQPPPALAQLIDWDNPLTQGLVLAVSNSDQGYGFSVNGNTVFPYVGATQLNTPAGSGGKSNSATSPLFSVSGHGLTTTNYSLFALATCGSASVTQNALDMDNSGPRYFQFRLSSGKVEIIPFNTSAGVTGQPTIPTAMSVSEMSRGFGMGATVSASRVAAFQNDLIATATPTNLIAPTQSLPLFVGSRATGTAGGWSNGAIILEFAWNRTLADSEMQSVIANPYQMFKPQARRLYMVSPSAGADGTANVSGNSATSAVGNITASGAASTTVTGNSATAAVNGATATGSASATVTSVSTASATGTVTATGTASTAVTGNSATSGTGAVTATGDANAALTGVSATSAVGTIAATAGGSATAPITGVSAASGVGTVAGSGGATATLGTTYSQGKVDVIDATGGASTVTVGVQAAASVGTITASGATGAAVANIQGISATGAVGTISATGTRTTIEVNVTEDMICRIVRNYIKSIAPTLPALRTPVNRASMPNGPYVSFTPGLRRPLSTNVSSNDANSRTVRRPEQMSFQIDCYGEGSAELAETLNMLYRDHYACEQFATSGLEIVPLYAGDIQQAPFVNDADQYEERYTFEIELQVNSSIIVPLQSCNILDIDLVSVDANFPPTEE